MKVVHVTLSLFIFCVYCLASNESDVLKFKAKIGFEKAEDTIIEHKFLDNDKKLLIIGQKNIQLWDVENGKLINSVSHEIPQFVPKGFFSKYVLLSLPSIFNWQPYYIEPNGKYIITIERQGENTPKSAVVRDLQTAKSLVVLNLPNSVSTDYIYFDKDEDKIVTFGESNKNGAFALWDKDNFKLKQGFSATDYKWHRVIGNNEKILVGAGSTKVLLTGANIKQGDSLTLRDIKTGEIEKEFTAQNLKPETAFQETIVSRDEKFLVSKRDDRIFVWEIAGNGQPKFEVSRQNPKEDFSFKEIVGGKFIVVKSDEKIRVYNVSGNGTPEIEILPANLQEDLKFAGIYSERFLFVKASEKLRIYDLNDKGVLRFYLASETPKDSVNLFGVTKDGKYAVVADDRKISVLDLKGDKKPLYEIVRNSEKERFPTITFLEDKNLLLVARVNRSEKKEPKTEFYDIPTGKAVFEAAFEANVDVMFTPDDKYLYQNQLGAFLLWNRITRKLSVIKLETYEPSYDSNTPEYLQESPRNTEFAEFSPDYRYILRYGDKLTSVFDTETGTQLQILFDTEKVKYDKNKNIKKSGLGKAGWSANGKYVYAFDENGFFGKRKTVNFWQVAK